MTTELGFLHIPKLKLEKISFENDINTRLYLQYYGLIKNNKIGKQTLLRLEQDNRVKELQGKMISQGQSAHQFNTENLAMWFLWAHNEFGEVIANNSLNAFLDDQLIGIMNSLWVIGIEVDESIQLSNGIRIIPAKEMPLSREQEHYLKHDSHILSSRIVKPQVAISKIVKVPKIGDSNFMIQDSKIQESYKSINDVCLILNAMKDIYCMPYFSTSYSLSQTPFGPFAGSSGSYPWYDITGSHSKKLSIDEVENLELLIKSYAKKSDTEKSKFSMLLSRVSQAKRRNEIKDKILDLCIALEMALLGDTKEQLKLTFSLRGSNLISTNNEENFSIFKALKDLYDYRSAVAHTGSLGKYEKKARHNYSRYQAIAERIIIKLICEDQLRKSQDWEKLILGIKG
ncbi:HEPN domain-containing protein [Cysteiniphilum marinum]|uniref:HEPN domain-containing protein n=1 Tax=Cysteiniphilum marinum TaxID=2774191 RepID=UPI00193AD623|nr:HEPN domain-containing protein [Cysteiniphilum marinum]